MMPLLIAKLIKLMGYIRGRKRLQKSVYLLQQLGLPFREEFQYGHYGPFSRTLQSELDMLVASQLVAETRGGGNEYRYRPAPLLEKALSAGIPDGSELDAPAATKAIRLLVGADVRVLEVASTWLFLKNAGYDVETLDDDVVERKPHLRGKIEDAKGLLRDLGLVSAGETQ